MERARRPEVPFLDLKAQYEVIRGEIQEAIQEVCESQQFILGPVVERFEEEVAAYCGARYAIGVSSGTDALLVALMALGIGPGDEVVTTAYSFSATAGVIARVGARPVFVDIDPGTYNIRPDLIEERITLRTRAIISVHLFGQCADMGPILEIARRHGLAVVEDAAQAIGAQYRLNGDVRSSGTMGDVGCLSFFPTKNLGGFGDGGMVLTNASYLAEKIRILRVHGARLKYRYEMIGGNFRLDALQAAILRVKLKYLPSWTHQRIERAERYGKLFGGVGLSEGEVIYPIVSSRLDITGTLLENSHIYNQYVIRVRERDGLRRYLQENGIETQVYYPLPLHLQGCFRALGYREGEYQETERAAMETLALPIYPELQLHQQERVVEAIREYFS